MGLSPEAIAVIAVFLLGHSGALIYFAGSVASTMKDHGKRLDKVEAKTDGIAATVAHLSGVMER